MKNIFSFNRKKKESKEIVINKVAILFNLANHASLLTAAIYAMLRQETGIQVALVDIRDAFPEDMDAYYWIDSGSPEQHKDFVFSQMQRPLITMADRTWVNRLKSCSTIIKPNDISENDRSPIDGIFSKMLMQARDEELIPESIHRLMLRFTVLSELFMTPDIDPEDCFIYYEALELAYRFYLGRDVKVDDFLHLSHPTEKELGKFMESQKQVNRALLYKRREIRIGSQSVQYLNALTPDLYGLIRRIVLAKKEFAHISMGSYGQVLYASIPISQETLPDRHMLALMPRVA